MKKTKMNNLTLQNEVAFLELLENMQTVEEIKSVLKKLDDLKALLKMADEFNAKSIQFAQLEATTLIKIASIGGTKALAGHRRKVAEWLTTLSENEQSKYIGMCNDGLSITEVWRREVKAKEDIATNIMDIKEDERELISDLLEDGYIDINGHCENTRLKLADKTLANDMNNGFRNRILKAGGVGVGNDSGIYVMPNSTNKELVKQAIIQRFDSVVSDLTRIVEISSKSGVSLTHQELLGDYPVFIMTSSGSAKDSVILHTFLGLCGAGLVSNPEEIYSLCSKEEIRRELAIVRNYIDLSKKQELEYLLSSTEKELQEEGEMLNEETE